jgi:hypothetical protein
MMSLSTARLLPILGGKSLHGKRVDLGAHTLAQRRVNELVLLHARLAAEGGAHNHRFKMMPVAVDLHVVAGKAAFDPAFYLLGIDQVCSLKGMSREP